MPETERPEPEYDGFVIPDVGAWSRSKHHFLRRYIYACLIHARGACELRKPPPGRYNAGDQ